MAGEIVRERQRREEGEREGGGRERGRERGRAYFSSLTSSKKPGRDRFWFCFVLFCFVLFRFVLFWIVGKYDEKKIHHPNNKPIRLDHSTREHAFFPPNMFYLLCVVGREREGLSKERK